MSYNAFLDAYFSTIWFTYGIPVLLVILLASFQFLYKNHKRKTLIRNLSMLIPVLLFSTVFINPSFWGYGRPVEIKDVEIIEGKLYVTDYILTANARHINVASRYRVHVIDPETGEKKLRVYAGTKGKLMSVHGDTLVFSHLDDVAFYSLVNGRKLITWSQETLPELFPQLSAGVNSFSGSKGKKDIRISSLDGKLWRLNTVTGILLPDTDGNVREEYMPTNKLFIDHGRIERDVDPNGKTVYELGPKDRGDIRGFIKTRKDSVVNNDISFLYGKIITVSEKDSCFIVMDYETTKRQKFIFTCVSLDGKRKLWEIKQAEFDAPVPDENAPEIEPPFYYDELKGIFYFSLKDEVIAVNSKDGKVKWRTKL